MIADISKDLYIKTKILVDLNPSDNGEEKAANEIVDQLFRLFEVLFDISSKAIHTKTKGSTQKYQLKPDYYDAEFSLTLGLNITNYLINRIRYSCQ